MEAGDLLTCVRLFVTDFRSLVAFDSSGQDLVSLVGPLGGPSLVCFDPDLSRIQVRLAICRAGILAP